MSRGTIEAEHKYQIENMKSKDEEIDYLLDVVKVLEAYGEENTKGEMKEENEMSSFVKVVGAQNNGSLYKEYKKITNNDPSDQIETIDSYTCRKCQVLKISIHNDSHMICPSCGETDIYFDSGTQGMSYEQEINSEVNTSFAYKRINHFNEWVAQFQAKESTKIPHEIIENVSNEFKKSRIYKKNDITQTKVKSFLKKLGYNKYYEHVPHITNILNNIKPPAMTLQLEEKLRSMFRNIQEPFEKHKPKTRSNFLSYSYCLYKFCELLGQDEFLVCFPLLKSREKLHQQDVIWKKICAEMNWEFIPTV